MTDVNRRVLLRARPRGAPRADDFELVREPVPAPGPGELLIRNEYCSLDPAMRGWMDEADSYIPPIPLGAAVRSTAFGHVVASQADGFAPGDPVIALNAIEDYSIATPAGFTTKVDPGIVASPTHFLSVAGAVGLTAYFGIHDVLAPKPGETLLVSGAAGAVGSLVGQLGTLEGCRAVGIAGGPEKCRRLTEEYGYAAVIDYRGRDLAAMTASIRAACPNGIDMFFDNVGGVALDAALGNLRLFARVALCGLISQYNAEGPVPGPTNLWHLITQRATMRGFLVADYIPRMPQAAAAMLGLVAAGKLRFREHIDEGIENFHASFMRLFDGGNTGKLILRLSA